MGSPEGGMASDPVMASTLNVWLARSVMSAFASVGMRESEPDQNCRRRLLLVALRNRPARRHGVGSAYAVFTGL